MPHVTGEERNQLIMLSLESTVSPDAFVRVVDAFVDGIDMESFGFVHARCKDEGRPSFHPSILMKLYLYGYHYGIRTSRKLEREACLNMEAMWLTSCQNPRYKTIADFRKNHAKAFRQVFRSFVLLLKEWELVDGKTIAVDSFKIRAQNSLKNNLNQNKINRHLDYIDNKIAEYENLLDQADSDEDRLELQQKITQKQERKEGYKKLEQQLEESGQEQISLTDPDARSVVLHRNIVNVGYNIQAVSDSKHKLLVEFETGDVNDSHALAEMAENTQKLLAPDSMDVLADKGYHTGQELQRCQESGIKTFVSPKDSAAGDSGVFPVTGFVYNPQDDSYTCPAGETMRTNGTWHNHSGKTKTPAFRFQRYTTPACKNCTIRQQCTRAKANGRTIERSEYAQAIERNNKQVAENPLYYQLRQQITEHPFGTLKRQRGFTFTLMKGKTKVLGEVGLEFIGYNLSRCVSILTTGELIKALKKCCLDLICQLFRLFSALSRNQPGKITAKDFSPVPIYYLFNAQQITLKWYF
jgi:transposase